MPERPYGSDHDVLIELRTDVKNILNRLERNVPEKCVDHGSRLAATEDQIKNIWSRINWAFRVAVTTLITLIIALAAKILGR